MKKKFSQSARPDSFAPWSILLVIWLGILMCMSSLQAQTLKVRMPLNDAGPGTTTSSDTSGGGASLTMQLLNFAGVGTDYHGAVGSGVAGFGRALDFSSNTNLGTAGANLSGGVAQATSQAGLGFGSVSSFSAAVWFKLDSMFTNNQNHGGRVFILGSSSASDIGQVNALTFHFQNQTQLQFRINTNTIFVNFASPVPTNTWLFFALTYDGSAANVYMGTESTAATNYPSTNDLTSAQTLNFGSAGNLYIGNRPDRARGVDGWLSDFRFYTGTGDVSFIEGIRKASAPVGISNIYPDGLKLFESSSQLTFNANSVFGIDPSGIAVTVNGSNVTSGLVVGGTPTLRSVSYTGLPVNLPNSVNVAITVTDSAGYTGRKTASYDSLSSTNFTWEAEDYDHDGGQFIDNPQPDAYAGLSGDPSIDYNDINHVGLSPYRPYDTMFSTNAYDLPRPAYDNTGNTDYKLGQFAAGEWVNWTRTFPAGVYNVYVRAANNSGVTRMPTLSVVTNGWGTVSQLTRTLGTFTVPNTGGWYTFTYVPLKDNNNNLVKVDFGGKTNTLQWTSDGSCDVNFFLIYPADTTLPTVTGVYPDGSTMFQYTNKLTFTVSSAAGINTNSVSVLLTVTNLVQHKSLTLTATNGLVFSGYPTNWNVAYNGLISNAQYTVQITINDANNNTASTSKQFGTYLPSYTWEGEDYDYNGGSFIDNPQTNAYSGFLGIDGIDDHNVSTGADTVYRAGDGIGTETTSDVPRAGYVGSSTYVDYDVGYFASGEWVNYTRTYPAGTYNIFLRAAEGNATATTPTLSLVTNGWGTTNQGLALLGSFNAVPTGGWQNFTWMPLRDAAGNVVQFKSNGTTNTLRLSSVGDVNVNFLMLLPAETNLPFLSGVTPNGQSLYQPTNTLSFSAGSPAGVATNNVVVTLNGVTVAASNLVFSGSSTSWTVTCPWLQPNMGYTAVITVTDANGNSCSSTVQIGTYSPAYYTWEGEDYDFNGGSFIDNPQTNAYAGKSGIAEVDFHDTPTTNDYRYYRPDFYNTGASGDLPRPQYANSGLTDYCVNYFTTNEWLNYTRTFPAGEYNIVGRFANGGTVSRTMTLSTVTGGWGTANQTTAALGYFNVPITGSWQTYGWFPLVDTNGNKVSQILGGTNTLHLSTVGDVNLNFFTLVPVLKLHVAVSGNNAALTYPSQSGFKYQVEYKNHLTDSAWTPLGSSVPGDGTQKLVPDPLGVGTRFYRVRVQ